MVRHRATLQPSLLDREGASPLPNVLEARRNARDVMAQYIDDVAALWTAIAAQKLVTLTERP